MNKEDFERILEVLENEREAELQCAFACKRLRKNTLNPIRRLRCHFDANRFMQHVFGIDLAIRKFKQASDV